MKQVMQRLRNKNHYEQPKNLMDIVCNISQVDDLKDILKAVVNVDGKMALIFSSSTLLNHLNRQLEVFMDGTFKVFNQTIHLKILNINNVTFLKNLQ